MSYFETASEVETIFGAFLDRFLREDEVGQPPEQRLTAPARAVLHLTEPEATLSVDLTDRRVLAREMDGASVRLELDASSLHDILLDRLDPVQISRLFEEDRATIDGRPEALVGFIRLVDALAKQYPASLAEQGREDLLQTPAPPTAIVWRSEEPPRRMIGKRRSWQRSQGVGEPV